MTLKGKIIAAIIVIVWTITVSITAVKYYNAVNYTPSKASTIDGVDTSRFDTISTNYLSSYEEDDDVEYRILIDTETTVEYLMISDRWGVSITPLYNEDGSLFLGSQIEPMKRMSGGQ